MKTIHVLRKPCSESTVALNVLRQGVGGLNIGNTRIKHVLVAGGSLALNPHLRQGIKRGQSLNPTAYTLGDDGVGTPDSAGRWPANLILQHLEGCRQDGSRTVKASAQATGPTRSGASHSVSRSSYSGAAAPAPSYGGADGRESIPAWTCEPGCPVAALDQQSGISSGVVRKPTGKPLYSTEGRSMVWNSNSVVDTTERGFADAGGASRFFKQFHGKPE